MKAVILCDGRGTGLYPLTENTPEALVRVLNKPVLDTIIEKVAASGITEIYLSLGFMANEITEHCEKNDYGAEINFCYECKPLGTAGGVANCIKNSDDDILVVTADGVFDFDLQRLYDFHYGADSDFTVCAAAVNDPRGYGMLTCDDDGSITSYIENSTWEQTEGNLINTGIYVFKGSVLSKIPEGRKVDFAEDIFPVLFSENLRFMCYEIEGFWEQLSTASAYRSITKKILDKECGNFTFEGAFYGKDIVLENEITIKAPCIIGKNTVIGNSSTIGPYCVIGADCSILDNCVISEVIIGDNGNIGCNTELIGCITDDCANIEDSCIIEENCLIGFNCTVGRFSRVLSGNRIWPGRRVAPGTVVTRDLLYENPDRIEFDIFGLSGKANSQISLSDIAVMGHAIASTPGIRRIGIGCDEAYLSECFSSVLISGMRACGALCYDFGEMFRAQGYFYSAYCNLDYFVYVSSSGDVVSFSFFGKNGMPVNAGVSRRINNNYKFSAFTFVEPSQYNEIFNMKLFGVVYKSFFKKLCPTPLRRLRVAVETDNTVIKELADELFTKSEIAGSSKQNLQILINNTGTELFAIENGTVFPGERIMALLCEISAAEGSDVIIPEDAPSFIEENAEKYGQKVMRVFENCTIRGELSDRMVMSSLWTFDMFLMLARLLKVLEDSGLSLASLFESYRNFAIKKTVMDIDCNSSGIRNLIMACGAERSPGDIYFVFDSRAGSVRLRQMGNSRKIRILAEAEDMEAAKEISVFVTKKIKDANIDNDVQK